MADGGIQQLTPDVFVALPESGEPNAMSRYWHEWHRVRDPQEQALLEARLRAMSPDQQYALLDRLYQERTQFLTAAANADAQLAQQALQHEQNMIQQENSYLDYYATRDAAMIQARGQADAVRLGIVGTTIKNRDLAPETAAIAQDFQTRVNAAADQFNNGDPKGAQRALAEAAQKLARDRQNLPDGQQDALGQVVAGIDLPFNDPTRAMQGSVRVLIQGVAPPPAKIEIPETPGVYAPPPPRLPSSSPQGVGRAPGAVSAAAAAESSAPGTTAPPSLPGVAGAAQTTPSTFETRPMGQVRSPTGDELRKSADEIAARIAKVTGTIDTKEHQLGGVLDPWPGSVDPTPRAAPAPKKKTAQDLAGALFTDVPDQVAPPDTTPPAPRFALRPTEQQLRAESPTLALEMPQRPPAAPARAPSAPAPSTGAIPNTFPGRVYSAWKAQGHSDLSFDQWLDYLRHEHDKAAEQGDTRSFGQWARDWADDYVQRPNTAGGQ